MADVPHLCRAEEAVALLAPGLAGGEVGVLAERPLVAVLVDDGPVTRELARVVATAPVVVVAVVDEAAGDRAGEAPAAGLSASLLDAFDVVIAAGGGDAGGAGGDEGVPRAVVTAPDPTVALAELADGVAGSPAAAMALVQLLRAGARLPVGDAVVAESWVYSMLQAGRDHRIWLDGRRPAAPVLDAASPVRARRHGPRLDVVLERPARRNAVGAGLRDALDEALAVALADPTVGEVHLWGRGPSFCSGGDLDEFGTAPDPVTAHLVRTTRSPALDLAALGPRLTAHVQGAAVGAGCEWAAFAGHVTARADAVFRLPELSMGLVPGAGGTASVPRRIGRQRTAVMALTGRPVGAERALAWGLVDEVVDAPTFAGAQPPGLRWTDTA